MKQLAPPSTVSQFIKKINNHTPITENVSLAVLTTFKCGGKARYFCAPKSKQELIKVIKYAYRYNIPTFLLGYGANILVSENGFDGLVIYSANLCTITHKRKRNNSFIVTAQCGTTMSNLQDYLLCKQLTGFEVFNGLPSSIGGAVYMNARCYEESISKHIYSITYLTQTGKVKRLSNKKIQKSNSFNYKQSPFTNTKDVILSVSFLTAKGSYEKIKKKMDYYYNERVKRGHFLFPSAGSIFKNNHAFKKPSGQLIEEANLKGKTIGGAQIAPFHGNIIINQGNATANDIKNLILLAQQEVLKKSGFMLEPEIIFVGEWQ